MNKYSIIICLLTLYGYNNQLPRECEDKIRGDRIKCAQTIANDLNCDANEKYGVLSICESTADIYVCCRNVYVIGCTTPFVEQSCGVDLMHGYVVHHSGILGRCESKNYSYRSEACEQYIKHRINIKLCLENFEPKREQCLRSANENWHCIPNCGDDWQRVCCSRWQYSDCMRAEAIQICDQLVVKEVITPFVNKVMDQTNCTQFITGSEQCKKSQSPETTKKSKEKESPTLLIIVGVIFLSLIIIGAILLIWCLCKKRKKSEDITESQQIEHNQQKYGETGEEVKSGEEMSTLRTNNSSSVDSSANESDSAKINENVK